MTISFRAGGAVVASTLTPAPSYPAGVQATDISVLTVWAKPNSGVTPEEVTCATPSGWTLLFEGSSGNQPPPTPEGSGGSNNIWIFTRTGGAYTGSVTLTLTNHSVAAAVIDTYAGSSGGWNTSVTFGYDNDSSGSPYNSNATVGSSNLGMTVGDWLLVRSNLTNTSGVNTPVITAAGTTLAAATVRHSQLSQITTPDNTVLWLDARDTTVSSGTSTAGPVMSLNNVQDGISVFILLREGIRNIDVTENVTVVEKSSFGAQADLPEPRQWANDDMLDAATLNAAFRDPIRWMMTEAPGIQLENTVTPSNFNATTYTIPWNATPRYRRGSIILNGSKVSVPTTGYYVGEISLGLKDTGTMNNGWLLTIELLMYPGGTATPNVQNIIATFADMATEQSFAIGSVPFGFYLNQGDAIEARISGSWGSAGTALLTDLPSLAILVMLDLHWQGVWAGGAI